MIALHETHKKGKYDLEALAYVGAIKEDKRGVIVSVMSADVQMNLVIWNARMTDEAKKAVDHYITFCYSPQKYNSKYRTLTISDFDILSDEDIKKTPDVNKIVTTVKPYVDDTAIFKKLLDRLVEINPNHAKILEQFQEDFKTQRASTMFHHNYRGGLLRHTFQVLTIAESIAKLYKDVDMELLTLGAIFHDIGKLDTYDKETGATTDYDRMYGGHLITGQKYVYANFREYKRLDDLINIIASHHGSKDWGALTTAATIEAHIVFIADYLSSHGDTLLKEMM